MPIKALQMLITRKPLSKISFDLVCIKYQCTSLDECFYKFGVLIRDLLRVQNIRYLDKLTV